MNCSKVLKIICIFRKKTKYFILFSVKNLTFNCFDFFYRPKISERFGSLRLGKLNKGRFCRLFEPWFGPFPFIGGCPCWTEIGGRGAPLFNSGPGSPVLIGTPWLLTMGIPPGGTWIYIKLWWRWLNKDTSINNS